MKLWDNFVRALSPLTKDDIERVEKMVVNIHQTAQDVGQIHVVNVKVQDTIAMVHELDAAFADLQTRIKALEGATSAQEN